MGYKTDVRMITTLQGFREIKKFADEKIKENNDYAETLKEPDINEKYKDIVRLGWTDMRGNEVELLKDCMFELMEKDISYRVSYMGENIEDIEEDFFDSQKDKNRYIPYPSIIRLFDDKEDKRELEEYAKDNQNKKEEEMECE